LLGSKITGRGDSDSARAHYYTISVWLHFDIDLDSGLNEFSMIKEFSPHDRLVVALGQILQEQRVLLGMSQCQLAEASDFHRSYISDVERGYRNISLRNLSRLARALDLPVSTALMQAERRIQFKFVKNNIEKAAAETF
jgi:plasmid maintenance system antidote protein VapI